MGQGDSNAVTISGDDCVHGAFVGVVEGGGSLEEGLHVGDMCSDGTVEVG